MLAHFGERVGGGGGQSGGWGGLKLRQWVHWPKAVAYARGVLA